MGIEQLSAGKSLPDDINVVIEIPSNQPPIKYEFDKNSSMVVVDRFLGTSMLYPCEYGFVPHTLSLDGDPVDVLVVSPISLTPGVVIRCRPVGVLKMTDESGQDAKILAVPVNKLTPRFSHVEKPEDLGKDLLNRIEHFFTHYKDLEPGKWVKIEGWASLDEARKEILDSATRYEEAKKKEVKLDKVG